MDFFADTQQMEEVLYSYFSEGVLKIMSACRILSTVCCTSFVTIMDYTA